MDKGGKSMSKPLITLGVLIAIITPFVILLFGKLSYLFVTSMSINMPSNSAGFISYMMTIVAIGGIVYLLVENKGDNS